MRVKIINTIGYCKVIKKKYEDDNMKIILLSLWSDSQTFERYGKCKNQTKPKNCL
jgi:hypothetical protein